MEKFDVNPAAESVAASVAKAVLAISIVIGVILFIVGLTAGYGLACLLGAAYLILIGVICWAVIRMFVNISRSLYNINEKLDQKQDKVKEETFDIDYDGGGKFKEGQLVIVKDDWNDYSKANGSSASSHLNFSPLPISSIVRISLSKFVIRGYW